MARVSKVCHSEQCGGTKQPAEITFIPASAEQPSADGHVYKVRCKSCGQVHPPDSTESVADGRGWAKKLKAEHGRIPIPLPPAEE